MGQMHHWNGSCPRENPRILSQALSPMIYAQMDEEDMGSSEQPLLSLCADACASNRMHNTVNNF